MMIHIYTMTKDEYSRVRRDLNAEHKLVYRLTDGGTCKDGSRVLWKRQGSHLIIRADSIDGQSTQAGLVVPLDGEKYSLRLTAAPSVSIRPVSPSGRCRGRRQSLHDPAKVREWLTKKLEANGMAVDGEIAVEWMQWMSSPRGVKFNAVSFVATITITDAPSAATALEDGIGPCKAWGMGLGTLIKVAQ